MIQIEEVEILDIRNALERLCSVGAPSGFESPAARVAEELLRPLTDEVFTTRLGSVIGVQRCGKPGAKKLLLDAHLDEIGLIVAGHEDGYLRFRSIGGVDPRMLPDREVTVLSDPPRLGVVACLPPHVLTAKDRDKSTPLSELFIDVGLTQEEALARIPVGTPIVYRESCFPLGEDQICGKSMDDRACFVTLLRAAELLRGETLDVDLYIMGSTREEVGGYGAQTATFALAPDWCVAVDVTHGKTPDSPKGVTVTMGGGPAVGIGPNIARWMSARLMDKGAAEGIPCQPDVMEGNTGTNGWDMQIVREGIATAIVSLPLKYMHTPMEVVKLSDIEDTARLLAAFARDLGKEAVTPC